MQPRASRVQRHDDELERALRLPEHDLRLQPQHAKPKLRKPSGPATICRTPEPVLRPIHLHDEPRRRSEEVDDVAGNHDLPAKLHAELCTAQRLPEQPFRLRRSLPHGVSPSR